MRTFLRSVALAVVGTAILAGCSGKPVEMPSGSAVPFDKVRDGATKIGGGPPGEAGGTMTGKKLPPVPK